MKKKLLILTSIFSVLAINSLSAYYCAECGSYTSQSPSSQNSNGYYRPDNSRGSSRDNNYRDERYPKPSQYRDDSQDRNREGSYYNQRDQRDSRDGSYYNQGGRDASQRDYRGQYPQPQDSSYDRDDRDQGNDNSNGYYPKPSQDENYRDNNDRRGDNRSDQNWSDQDDSKRVVSEDDRRVQNRVQKNLIDKKVLAHPEAIQIWILEGEATLRGNVKSEDEKAKLKDFVKSQEGVKSVNDKVTVDSNTRSNY